jgi:hypothetical protein
VLVSKRRRQIAGGALVLVQVLLGGAFAKVGLHLPAAACGLGEFSGGEVTLKLTLNNQIESDHPSGFPELDFLGELFLVPLSRHTFAQTLEQTRNLELKTVGRLQG